MEERFKSQQVYTGHEKFSHNPALCRYALQLQQFKYKMEWVPGVKLIANPLSRLVFIPTGSSEAFTLPEIVFGRDLGQHIFYEKHAPSPGRPLQLTSLLRREKGVTNRWIQRVRLGYERMDGEPFEMYVMCKFVSVAAIPMPKGGGDFQLSPLRTADPAIGQGRDEMKGVGAVWPVQLSNYDKELLNEIGSCRNFLLGKEKLSGRRRKLIKRLVKGMSAEEGVLWKEAEVGRVRVCRRRIPAAAGAADATPSGVSRVRVTWTVLRECDIGLHRTVTVDSHRRRTDTGI